MCRHRLLVFLLPALVLPLLVLPAPRAPAREAGGSTAVLRVATYNIAAGTGADGAFDLDRTAAAIRALDADIVGLQEVDVRWSSRSGWRDEAAELARALGMHGYFAPIYTLAPPSPGAPPRRFGLAILSRHRILHAENHPIARLSTQVPDPVPATAPGFPEVVVRVRGAAVHMYATHLDHRADPAVRRAQVADMRRIMARDRARGRERRALQILVGDLNARPGAQELAPLWSGLSDAWPVAGDGGPGHTYPAAAPDRRIDYVAVSPGVRVRGAVVGSALASDHRPVTVDLTVPPPPHTADATHNPHPPSRAAADAELNPHPPHRAAADATHNPHPPGGAAADATHNPHPPHRAADEG